MVVFIQSLATTGFYETLSIVGATLDAMHAKTFRAPSNAAYVVAEERGGDGSVNRTSAFTSPLGRLERVLLPRQPIYSWCSVTRQRIEAVQ
jgi:hypothetical protein